jgi:polar amino acid transport system substrate-binding protein
MTRAGRTGLIALCLLASLRSLATADALTDVRARDALVWGGDEEGGGPYVYPRDDDPNQTTGFEVEIAARLAKSLGVTSRFFQGPWDRMPEMLRTRKIDIVLNGYEWTPARLETMDATIPYFVYRLQLMARADDTTLKTAGDLANPRPDGRRRRLGVLTGSAAETYARREFGAVEVV